MKKTLSILGIRGIPAAHGGFETFAEQLSLYLVERGWSVNVYCQENADFHQTDTSEWRGVKRIHIPTPGSGAVATIIFDWLSTRHAARQEGLVLTLGYNTALFSALYRFHGKANIMNMDGIEWKREKWNVAEKIWLYLNERVGCLLANHLVADHPEIQRHLATRINTNKITMIPYGARKVNDGDPKLLEPYNLVPKKYAMIVARAEPENNIYEIVRAFSNKKRDCNLLVLGQYIDTNSYHRLVLETASDEVLFPGAVYDSKTVDALRYHSLLYIHGHSVGGTNPSLVEALGSGQAILAHDNIYNRWVAGDGSRYFSSVENCEEALDDLLRHPEILKNMSLFSRQRFEEEFTWDKVLKQYESLLSRFLN